MVIKKSTLFCFSRFIKIPKPFRICNCCDLSLHLKKKRVHSKKGIVILTSGLLYEFQTSEARAKLVCVCVCLEGVHQECGKHISNEQIKASLTCFLILGQSEDGL